MEQYLATIFEDIRHERNLVLLLILVEPDILKQNKFTDHEIDIIRNIALEKVHRQRNLIEIVALDLLEEQFSDQKMTYPNIINEPELLKIKRRGDKIKNLKYQTEKQDHEKLYKRPKNDNEYYKKKFKTLNKKNVLIIITENLIGSASSISSSTLGLINPGAGIIISSSTTLLANIAILITNEYTQN